MYGYIIYCVVIVVMLDVLEVRISYLLLVLDTCVVWSSREICVLIPCSLDWKLISVGVCLWDSNYCCSVCILCDLTMVFINSINWCSINYSEQFAFKCHFVEVGKRKDKLLFLKKENEGFEVLILILLNLNFQNSITTCFMEVLQINYVM